MSQFLFRLSKLSSRKHGLIQRKTSRLFSSSETTPYLMCGLTVNKVLPDGSNIGEVLLFDPAKEEMVTVADKTIPEDLVGSRLVGSCNGWGLFTDKYNRFLSISNYLNPFASKSNPNTIPLPPLAPAMPCDSKFVRNVALSTDYPNWEDFVVAIKFLGNHLSFYRHGRDLRWTNVDLSFGCSDNSNLFYSKKEESFFLPTPGGDHLLKWDIHFKDEEYPEFCKLLFRDVPKFTESEWEVLNLCSRAERWVESSSGESFLIQWYTYVSPPLRKRMDPEFIVYSEEEATVGTYMCYTEDIGDLCIFLSNSQPFCVPASSCPGLEPNSIYTSLEDFGVYNLATKTYRRFEPLQHGPITVAFQPHWLPPVPI